ncbi:hypothetical protein SAMN05421812_117184 [Asanoa hainanensis]|uniref:Uncharacterized protein n=1 Tax=Asanoa hainanensis TaxID=560556 RepID=A0A239PCI5_9ACTN|nr:hypothetical protein [Asanoa hainanensis]SNT64672.1 hypothetical protein SAMN05421812_117184 [Asanoa hainanensis]
MPQLVTVRVERPAGRPVRLWVPVLPIALVLLPVLVLAAGLALVAAVVYRVNVLTALAGGWRVFSALRGTQIDVAHGRTAVLVAIR